MLMNFGIVPLIFKRTTKHVHILKMNTIIQQW